MCEEMRDYLFLLLLALFFVSAAVVLRAEEPESWYLISETELRSIEQYKKTSEQEKRNWQSQVQLLNAEANILHLESIDLNGQLTEAREQNRKSTILFNEYAQDWLIKTALKNGEIADLKQETEKYKGIAKNRLIIVIALGAAWVIFIAFNVCRFFRII